MEQRRVTQVNVEWFSEMSSREYQRSPLLYVGRMPNKSGTFHQCGEWATFCRMGLS